MQKILSFRASMIYALGFVLFSVASPCQSPAQPAFRAAALKCEYLSDPLGIDALYPRLSWRQEDSRQGATQTAYQLSVGVDSVAVSQGRGDHWVLKEDSDAQLVPYHGKPLHPFTKYFWTVRVWDQDGVASSWAPAASFETGMMEKRNWKGAWISDNQGIDEKAAPFFRKEFQVAKSIKSARAYIAVAGLYELYLNGKRIGDHQLDPMYTRFDRRTLYVTYDVTRQLQEGSNAIGVLLGNGWYNHQSTAVWDFHKAPWRNRPAFCLDLRITYEDGTVETITSGKDWKTALSPVIFNSIYTAEHYDGRREQPGWSEPRFEDSTWASVIFRSAPAPVIAAQALPPIRHVEALPASSMRRFSDTMYVFDLGRNIAGVSRLTVTGARGTVLRLRHAERLGADGRTDQSNIDIHYRPTDDSDPFQTDIFILKGEGQEVFTPRFNYKGFQYVEVTSSRPVTLTKESLTAYFMHSDLRATGQIRSSNPTVNKIWEATNASYLSNLFGYPTDCPQREKNGWTGDAHIAIETALYNFDGITVYEKWLADHRDEQQPNGVLPAIIPTGGWGYEWANGPDWTSTIAIIPWNIYLFYGDTTLLSASYEHLKRYVDYLEGLSPDGIMTWGLGDWVPVKSKTPVEFTSTVYYYVDVDILAKAATILGRQADHGRYAALAEKIKTAFNTKFLNVETGLYGSGLQTELSVPLQWGLVPDTLIDRVAANLARRVQADDNHIDVGLLGTKAILNALSENGYADLAYRVAAQESYPSWGWWIVNGATTLYENWVIDAQSDISLNHIMFGEIGAWFYKALGGIKPDPGNPGFKHILLEPHFVTDLDLFEATHASRYGTIRSAWERQGKKMSYTVTVPPNTTATLRLPVGPGREVFRNGVSLKPAMGQVIETLTAGAYRYEWE